MKNNVKFFTGLICGIVLSGLTVYAATIISGRDVSFDNSKTGMKSTNVQDAVDEIYSKTKVGDAGSDDILYGKSALVKGVVVNGSMKNNGPTGGTIAPGGSYKIPEGYTIGGTVTASPIPNTYKNLTTSTTATAAQIAKGYTAYNSAGTLITGELNNIFGFLADTGAKYFSTEILELASGSTKNITHNLGHVPKYALIIHNSATVGGVKIYNAEYGKCYRWYEGEVISADIPCADIRNSSNQVDATTTTIRIHNEGTAKRNYFIFLW